MESNNTQQTSSINNINQNNISGNTINNNNTTNTNFSTNVINNTTLDDALMKLQNQWTENIKELNEKMKTLRTVDDLLNEVYYKRQDAVDLFYGTNKALATQTRDYKFKASNIYNALKSGQAGLRYTNESAITMQIESKLFQEKENIDLLTNFCSFMKDTIVTIDNIIYGINNKVKVNEMLNGLKF